MTTQNIALANPGNVKESHGKTLERDASQAINVTVQDGILTMPDGSEIDLKKIQASLNNAYHESGEREFMDARDKMAVITALEQEPIGEFVPKQNRGNALDKAYVEVMGLKSITADMPLQVAQSNYDKLRQFYDAFHGGSDWQWTDTHERDKDAFVALAEIIDAKENDRTPDEDLIAGFEPASQVEA